MTVAPPLPRTAVPPPRPAPTLLAPPASSAPARRRGLRDRLRERAALRREERAWAQAFDRAPTPSARAELQALREYARG